MGLISLRRLFVTFPALYLAVSLILVSPVSAYTAEQVTNGDFSAGLTGWTTNINEGPGSSYASITPKSSGGQSGGYVELWVTSGSAAEGWANAAISQSVDLTGVDTLSLYVYCDYIESYMTANRFSILIDGSQKFTTTNPGYYSSWTKIDLDVSGYSGYHTIKFYVSTSARAVSMNIDTVSAIGTYSNPTVHGIGVNKESGQAPLTVAFEGFVTDGFPLPTYYTWTWGDGTAVGTSKDMSHTFNTAGTYNVRLEAWNSKSTAPYSYKTKTITVTEPPDSNATFDESRYLSTDTAILSTHIKNYNPATKTYSVRLYEIDEDVVGGLVGTWPIASVDATTQIPVGNYPPGNYVAYLYESEAGIGTAVAYATAEFSYTVGYFGKTYDAETGEILDDVSLSFVQGGTTKTTTSNVTGDYSVLGFSTGTQISVSATKAGYTHDTIKVTPPTRLNYPMDIYLFPETPSHEGTALAGIVTDAETGSGISGATVNLMGASTKSTTTSITGYYRFDNLNPGITIITASAPGYKSSSSTEINLVQDNFTRYNIALSSETPSGQTGYGVQYPPHNVKFNIISAFGGAIAGVSVTATPLESSNPWDWLEDLLGVPGKADIKGTILRGSTGTDGGITFAMIESVKYRIDIYDPERGIDTSVTIYPKEDETTIYIWPNTPPPQSDIVDYSLTATVIDGDTTQLTLRYVDGAAKTTSVTFYVSDEEGEIIETVTRTGESDLTISYNVTNKPGEVYLFGFTAQHTEFGEIKQDQFIRFSSNRPAIDFATWIPLWAYEWTAIGLLVCIAAIFGFGSLKYGVVLVPVFGLLFSFVGWLSTPPLIIISALVLGVMMYIRISEGETGA